MGISQRKNQIRTNLCGNSDRNFLSFLFAACSIFHQLAQQIQDATKINILIFNLVSPNGAALHRAAPSLLKFRIYVNTACI